MNTSVTPAANGQTTENWQAIRKQAEQALTPAIVAFIEECRQQPHPESQLISVLHAVQEQFGYLGSEHLDAVAQLLRVPAAKVSGVATFYHFFRLQPKGEFVINVCMGTACYVKGAERLVQRIQDELGIAFGETTGDGMFSLFESRCLGTCGLAPVLMINDNVHGHVTPDQIPALLETYRNQARSAAEE